MPQAMIASKNLCVSPPGNPTRQARPAKNKDVRDEADRTDRAGQIQVADTGQAFFGESRFKQNARFNLARFDEYATFAAAEFGGSASFEAIRGERGFTMARARFDVVPDFIQAHFAEAPRLDNLEVVGRIVARHPRPERKEAKSWWLKPWRTLRYVGGAARTWPKRAACGRLFSGRTPLQRPSRSGCPSKKAAESESLSHNFSAAAVECLAPIPPWG